MHNQRATLVTGVGSYWGSRLAGRLADLPAAFGRHVVGLDMSPPTKPIAGVSYIQADVWDARLVNIIRDEQVETLCYLTSAENLHHARGAPDLDVTGVLKLLAASSETAVSKIILMSSTMIYGARPDNSAFLTEEHARRGDTRAGTIRNLIEIEAFCDAYRLERPEVALTVLRFPSIVGPTADTPMTRFLKSRLTPTPLGFDPVIQVIHEDDVVEALTHVVFNDANGAFNVAAEGAIPLSKLMAQAGKLPLPLAQPVSCSSAPLLRLLPWPIQHLWPLPPDYLRYPWVAALDKMRHTLGFTPQHTAEETLREFADCKQPGQRTEETR